MGSVTITVISIFNNSRKKIYGKVFFWPEPAPGIFYGAVLRQTLPETAKIGEDRPRFDNKMLIKCV
ncbi:hypothetical protein CXU22_12525 [Akkermansia muciniphila]|uniref:Uncharacterized protein n=1 Tax=Akkermansia muciniphila TaxID=239935 RepID=A0A2N8HC31_9BACT|nr:hypothetical protein CXU22_12525 [Akkermansia muciniphila]